MVPSNSRRQMMTNCRFRLEEEIITAINLFFDNVKRLEEFSISSFLIDINVYF